MAVGKVTVRMSDANGNGINENLGYTDVEVRDATTAQPFDTFGRAIAGLTNNTYVDTIITYETSVNEVIAEG